MYCAPGYKFDTTYNNNYYCDEDNVHHLALKAVDIYF